MLLLSTALAMPRVSVATDVSPWFLDGFSGLVMVEGERWRSSAEVWSFRFPSAVIELNAANAELGWEREVDYALAFYIDRHLLERRRLHVGAAWNTMHSTVRREDAEASFWSTELLVRVGWRWFPFPEAGLFIDPWVGAGPLYALSEPVVAGERFDELPVQFLGTCHLGWRFGRPEA